MRTPNRRFAAFLLFAVLAAAPLSAQYRGLSAGLGAGLNGITIFDDLGAEALFTLENRLNRLFSLNLRSGATLPVSRIPDLGTSNMFLGLEMQMFLRLYLLSPPEMEAPRGLELFLEAGGGLITTMNGFDSRDTRGSPEATAILGLRIRLGKHLYVEPYIRSGYPSYAGAGLIAGLRFPAKKDTAASGMGVEEIFSAASVEKKPSDIVEGNSSGTRIGKNLTVSTGKKITGKSTVNESILFYPERPDIFVVQFEPEEPYFDGLDYNIANRNLRILNYLISLLKDNPHARLLIEGYASQSPYIRTKKYNSLVYLSELRAAYIADILSAAGISLDRLVKVGHGAKNPIVTVNDIKNKNQRAELRVLWPVDSQQDYEHLNRWW